METQQLNRIQLRGIVGSIKVSDISGTKVARITLATNYAYRSQDGCAVIETTWHNITAWEKPTFPALESICKGDNLYIEGRIKNQRYTRADGTEVYSTEVIATSLSIITGTLKMQE